MPWLLGRIQSRYAARVELILPESAEGPKRQPSKTASSHAQVFLLLAAPVMAAESPAEFPRIAVHVVEAEPVGLERSHMHRLQAKPIAAAVTVGIVRADFVATGIAARGAGARGVFPFGLR